MNTPQVIWIVLAALSLFVSLMKHGENRGEYSFWATLFSLAVEVWILVAGGFF